MSGCNNEPCSECGCRCICCSVLRPEVSRLEAELKSKDHLIREIAKNLEVVSPGIARYILTLNALEPGQAKADADNMKDACGRRPGTADVPSSAPETPAPSKEGKK